MSSHSQVLKEKGFFSMGPYLQYQIFTNTEEFLFP